MSRIGKKPVTIPKNVQASVSGQTVKVKGPKGELSLQLVDDVEVAMSPEGVTVKPRNDSKRARSMWGMQRTMVQNLMVGVTDGYKRSLEIQGVGFRAAMKGKDVQLNLGYSHEVVYKVPDGISIALPKPTEIVVSGMNKQQVGQVCAEIRKYRPPEPYQGKGVRLQGEFVFRKEGKKK
jgi:large subunit ribosomal protein L6